MSHCVPKIKISIGHYTIVKTEIQTDTILSELGKDSTIVITTMITQASFTSYIIRKGVIGVKSCPES